MELSSQQYEKICPCLPKQRGNVSIDDLTVLNAILYVMEQGCKWRGLPQHFGNWRTMSAATVVTFCLSGGNEHDAPMGRRLLVDGTLPEKAKFLLMDQAYEGDETRRSSRRPWPGSRCSA